VVINDLTKEQIIEALLKVMVSRHTFIDVTGVEVPLAHASLDRIDPHGDHTLSNIRVVFRGVNLFRTNAPDDRFLIEALQRCKGLPFSGLFKENFVALGAPESITLTIRAADAIKARASFRKHPAEAVPAPAKVAELATTSPRRRKS
jgi:hypothetical protein